MPVTTPESTSRLLRRLRAFGLLGVFIVPATLLTPAPRAMAADAALAAPIEQCIRGNAIKVSAAIPDLNQAVDFLVGKLCAKPVADAAVAAQQAAVQQYADQQRKACDDWKKTHPGVAPAKNDEEAPDPCAAADAAGSLSVTLGYSIITAHGDNAPPEATALAARLLLDLRLAHENPPGR